MNNFILHFFFNALFHIDKCLTMLAILILSKKQERLNRIIQILVDKFSNKFKASPMIITKLSLLLERDQNCNTF